MLPCSGSGAYAYHGLDRSGLDGNAISYGSAELNAAICGGNDIGRGTECRCIQRNR